MYTCLNLLGGFLGALHGRRRDEPIALVVIVVILLLELHLLVLGVVVLGNVVLGGVLAGTALAGSGSSLLARGGGGGRAGAGSLDTVGVAVLAELLDVLAVGGGVD